ncbi:hypothetical protein C8P63_13124 [Melghirimyces profundicolus]|uniref:Uncharacterized protein n=1 Tax=Melghirimyces profundicolus TaxID=1242148 RepID=A0A2T6B856_9BACL|nr:hypothetical protein [Melghirimyces profundicolus]PTX52208.1 hypothetical protein C8P63_13124 [Melghirimyces profundicolus]
MYMTVILIFITVLAIMGTLKNKRSGNKPGYMIGGLFTLALIGVTLLAIYDEIVGIE